VRLIQGVFDLTDVSAMRSNTSHWQGWHYGPHTTHRRTLTQGTELDN
jgi:hypothetical protein